MGPPPYRKKRMRRRRFLETSLAAGAALGLAAAGGRAPAAAPASESLIDVSVNLGRWPFRRLPHDQPAELAAMLRRHNVRQAWTANLAGLFHKDVRAANAWLVEQCKRHGDDLFIPFGTVNPMWLDWEEDLRRCHEEHNMPGIRLHPNYHRYTLDEPAFANLFTQAAERGLIVQIVPWMEDERHHHPLTPRPTVNLRPLPNLIKRVPTSRVMILNGSRTPGQQAVSLLEDFENVWFDFAKLDVIDGLGRLLQRVPAERVVFGSHAPLFYFESARLKMQESVLTPQQAQAIRSGNAQRLLGKV